MNWPLLARTVLGERVDEIADVAGMGCLNTRLASANRRTIGNQSVRILSAVHRLILDEFVVWGFLNLVIGSRCLPRGFCSSVR
jgi:hypothetical protein